jgi:hypothetical protein
LAIFTSFEISDQVQLAVAESAGLKPSQPLKGFVDELAMSNKGQARIRGWVADIIGQGSPTTILVFAQGKQIFETQTKGQRADMTALVRLSEPCQATSGINPLATRGMEPGAAKCQRTLGVG